MELGGALSHGAIVAREYELPAVANVAGAMQRLKDGQVVTVDGNRGNRVAPMKESGVRSRVSGAAPELAALELAMGAACPTGGPHQPEVSARAPVRSTQ
jgi:phosphoenolpyruvate-protein kinase (PTS system EI component)